MDHVVRKKLEQNELDTTTALRSLTMGFGDLKTSAGLSALNDYLTDKSYIEG